MYGPKTRMVSSSINGRLGKGAVANRQDQVRSISNNNRGKNRVPTLLHMQAPGEKVFRHPQHFLRVQGHENSNFQSEKYQDIIFMIILACNYSL